MIPDLQTSSLEILYNSTVLTDSFLHVRFVAKLLYSGDSLLQRLYLPEIYKQIIFEKCGMYQNWAGGRNTYLIYTDWDDQPKVEALQLLRVNDKVEVRWYDRAAAKNKFLQIDAIFSF